MKTTDTPGPVPASNRQAVGVADEEMAGTGSDGNNRGNSGKLLAYALPALAIAGSGTILWSTARWGAGVSSGDSVVYLGAARSLLQGQGLRDLGFNTPLLHFPPLYPFLLALVGLISGNMLAGARWIDALLFGANIFLTGLAAKRFYRSSPLALLPPLCALISIGILNDHLVVMSEAPFLFFEILFLWQLVVHLESGSNAALAVAGLSAGLAGITRYTGPALVAAGVIAIVVLTGKRSRTAVRNCVVFGVLSCSPTILWVARNLYLTGRTTDRTLVAHVIGLAQLRFGLNTIATWLVPAAVPLVIKAGLLLGITLAVIAGGIYLKRNSSAGAQSSLGGTDHIVPAVVAIFVACYVGWVLVSISFFDISTVLDDRMLSATYIPVLLGMAWMVWQLERTPLAGRGFQAATAILLAAFVLVNGVRCAARIVTVRRAGIGYTGARWINSPVIQRIKMLPPDAMIYTDMRSAVSFLTKMPASALPASTEMTTGRANPAFGEELARMRSTIQNHPAAVACFGHFPTSPQPCGQAIGAPEGLHAFLSDARGTLYVNEALAAELR